MENKTKYLNIRITEAEHKALHRIAKHYKCSIAEFLRKQINAEDLRLLEAEQGQERMFTRNANEQKDLINRAINIFSTISNVDTTALVKSNVTQKGKGKKRVITRRLAKMKKGDKEK